MIATLERIAWTTLQAMRSLLVGLVLLVPVVHGCAHPQQRGSVGPALLGGFGDALACGGALLVDALAKRATPGDYIDASACFIEHQAVRAAERSEAAKAASEEHGRKVVEAARAAEKFEQHPCPEHEREALEALRACEVHP